MFTTNSDDGSALFVDVNNDNDFNDPGEFVVDNRGLHGMQVRTGTVTLPTAGNYRVRTQMYERGGGAGLIATYGPNANSQIFLGQAADFSLAPYQTNVTSTADSTINVAGGRGADVGQHFGRGKHAEG